MDGIGGCIKNAVYRVVMVGKLLCSHWECTKAGKRNQVCLFGKKDVVIEFDEVKNARYITDMYVLQVHMATRVIKKSLFQCLKLYEIVSHKEPFHDQWYRRENGSEPCGHFNLAKNLHPKESCTKCFGGDIDCAWR